MRLGWLWLYGATDRESSHTAQRKSATYVIKEASCRRDNGFEI